jgi:dolichyl-phosphate-mannose--protein O-mannosyl transferase
MATFKRYIVIQAMMFVFGIVGPIFLIGYFAAQPDPTLKWMYWWGLFITAADILIALGLTSSLTKAEGKPKGQSRQSTTS